MQRWRFGKFFLNEILSATCISLKPAHKVNRHDLRVLESENSPAKPLRRFEWSLAVFRLCALASSTSYFVYTIEKDLFPKAIWQAAHSSCKITAKHHKTML